MGVSTGEPLAQVGSWGEREPSLSSVGLVGGTGGATLATRPLWRSQCQLCSISWHCGVGLLGSELEGGIPRECCVPRLWGGRGKWHGEETWKLSVLEALKAVSLGCILVFRCIWGCCLSAFAVA